MSPTLAAQQFQEVLTPYASGKIKLGAPAVTSRDAAKNPGKGLDWLFDFLDHCKTCQISFIPLHWYGYQPEGENVEAFKAYMTEARKKLVEKGWDKPIWVTELGVMDKSETENVNFLKDATSWMGQYSSSLFTKPMLMIFYRRTKLHRALLLFCGRKRGIEGVENDHRRRPTAQQPWTGLQHDMNVTISSLPRPKLGAYAQRFRPTLYVPVEDPGP